MMSSNRDTLQTNSKHAARGSSYDDVIHSCLNISAVIQLLRTTVSDPSDSCSRGKIEKWRVRPVTAKEYDCSSRWCLAFVMSVIKIITAVCSRYNDEKHWIKIQRRHVYWWEFHIIHIMITSSFQNAVIIFLTKQLSLCRYVDVPWRWALQVRKRPVQS